MGDAVQAFQVPAQELREGLELGPLRGEEVERHERGLRSPGGRDRVVGRLQPFPLAAEERDRGAVPCGVERHGGAEPLARAGDEDHAALQEVAGGLVLRGNAAHGCRAARGLREGAADSARRWARAAAAALLPLVTALSSVPGYGLSV